MYGFVEQAGEQHLLSLRGILQLMAVRGVAEVFQVRDEDRRVRR